MKTLKYAPKDLKCKLILRLLPPNAEECSLNTGAKYDEAIRLMKLISDIKNKR